MSSITRHTPYNSVNIVHISRYGGATRCVGDGGIFTLTLLTIFVATWLRNSWLNGYALAVMTKS